MASPGSHAAASSASNGEDDADQQLLQGHTLSDAVGIGMRAAAATAGRKIRPTATALDRLLPKSRGFTPISQLDSSQQQQQYQGPSQRKDRWAAHADIIKSTNGVAAPALATIFAAFALSLQPHEASNQHGCWLLCLDALPTILLCSTWQLHDMCIAQAPPSLDLRHDCLLIYPPRLTPKVHKCSALQQR